MYIYYEKYELHQEF